MKKSFLLLSPLFLAACGSVNQATTDLLLQNPLYAEQYSEDLVDSLVEMEIRKDPIIEDESKKKAMDEKRREWLEVAQKARKAQNDGALGNFIEASEYANGEVLYTNDMLYFGQTFDMEPGPSLRVFMTSVADPRSVTFPDEDAIDLGTLISPYGSQHYKVPATDQPELNRTVVIYDTVLERIYTFAQLNFINQ